MPASSLAEITQVPPQELSDLAEWNEKPQAHSSRTRLAQECAKLDMAEEQALAEEGLAAETSQWAAY